jgi:hypothetical protein
MSLLNSQPPNDRNTYWSKILATLIVELVVLLALVVGVVRYLAWSSDVNQAEFLSATRPSVSGPPSNPIHRVKALARCDRKA